VILQLNPRTRKLLIQCRCLAMRGDANGAIRQIVDAIASFASGTGVLDQVALLMLKAEILYLNCQEEEALEIFRDAIAPKLSSLPQEIATIVGRNRNDVARTVFEAGSDREFYHLYDQERVLGSKLWNPKAVVYAYEAVENERQYDALPIFRLELIEMYRQGCWRYYRHASKRMAKECVLLGWLEEATHHAVISQNEKLAALIGMHLLARRDADLIRRVIQGLLDNANLKLHALVACPLIATIADAIPDDQIDVVLRWLLRWCSLVPNIRTEPILVRAAWDTLQEIAPRLNLEQARNVVQTATASNFWEQTNLLREHMIDAVNICVAILPTEDLAQLANLSIPLATTYKHDVDYGKAINLLCHIADRSSNDVKTTIGNALYPTEFVENAILMQVAQRFGRQPASEEEADRIAGRVADDIRKQVQRLGPGEEAEFTGGYGRFAIRGNEGGISVSMYSFSDLQAVINHRMLLRANALQVLVEAVLSMISEPENIPANKVGLINGIVELSDRLTFELANIVFDTLAPLAKGEFEPSLVMQASGNADNPLNAFKINMGKLEDIRATALYALAHVEKHLPGVYGERLNTILEQAMTDIDPEIRRYAFYAVSKVPTVSPQVITGLLLGTRDADIGAASAAYSALATKEDVQLNEGLWHQLIYSLHMASMSPNVNIRCAAAFTIANLRSQCPSDEVTTKIQKLEHMLAEDICYSVRGALTRDPVNLATATSGVS
jgi:hypothetical protein